MRNIFFVLLLFSLSNCTKSPIAPDPTINTPTVPQTENIFYLALGDSYTIGESVAEGERYPIQLVHDLSLDSTIINTKIIARTGWTTQNLTNGINAETDLRAKYDLVSLLIGVNNQYQGRSIEEYKVQFRELLERAIGFAGNDTSRVFVVSIPDYAYTPFGNGNSNISQAIDEFNAANKSITEEYEIQYFDITPISRKGLQEPELVASDGLHPSGEQYGRWVALMREDVKAMLNN